MKTVILKALSLSIVILIIISIPVLKTLKKNINTLTIGIIQTASHPALDSARAGFMDTLSQYYKDAVAYEFYNVEGSAINADLIAKKLHNDNSVKAIYTIATLATQAALINEKEKPIVIAAVTDPYALYEGALPTNLCGITDMVNPQAIIDLIQLLVPHAQRVAILYNKAEINSIRGAQLINAELIKHNYISIHKTFSHETDIPAVLQQAINQADVIVTPTDNSIAAASSYIAQKAREAKKPLITAFDDPVKQGALASAGVNYYQSGKQAALCLIEHLAHQKPISIIGIQNTPITSLLINEQTAQELNIIIPTTEKYYITLT